MGIPSFRRSTESNRTFTRQKGSQRTSNDLLSSFKHAIEGIVEAILSERNLKIHFVIGISVIITAFFLPLSEMEMLWIIFAVFSVIGAELINTFVEGLLDVKSVEFNPRVKFVKDVAAGVVLWNVLFAVAVGVVILGRVLFSFKPLSGKIFIMFVLIFFPVLALVLGRKKHGKDKSDDSR